MARLDNAVTVVTGAGGGVGRQAALRLAAEGSRVGLTGLKTATKRGVCRATRTEAGRTLAGPTPDQPEAGRQE
jgi:NAD(P)-dependent dehydrogenase (short-subunit alcohol dehydrogenase family)